jgi:multicomponent Na+:H+ antiporter subunit B
VAHGSNAAVRRLPFASPARLSATGVLLAAASGLPGLARGDPYLTHLWWTLPLGPTSFDLSTVLLFDLGVFLSVWGALSGYALPLVDEGERTEIDMKAEP